MNISKQIMSFLVLGKPEGGKSKSKSGDKPKEGTYLYTSILIKNSFLNEYFYTNYVFSCIR